MIANDTRCQQCGCADTMHIVSVSEDSTELECNSCQYWIVIEPLRAQEWYHEAIQVLLRIALDQSLPERSAL